jgi:hypothetical protein
MKVSRLKLTATSVVGILASVPVLADFDLPLWCIEPTPKPKCCEAVTNSIGTGPGLLYHWDSDRGFFDPQATEVHWTEYHCNTMSSPKANLEVLALFEEQVWTGDGVFQC